MRVAIRRLFAVGVVGIFGVAFVACSAASDLPTGIASIHYQVCATASPSDPSSVTACCPDGAADRSPCTGTTKCWTSCLPIPGPAPGGSHARTLLTCDGAVWHAESVGSATVVHACLLPTDAGADAH